MENEFIPIKIQTSYGCEAGSLLIKRGDASDGLAILLPGAYNTWESPLLYYAGEIALHSGCDVLAVTYGYRAAGAPFSDKAFEPSLAESVELLNAVGIEKYRRVYFVGKSFGTIVAGELAKSFPGSNINFIFLTPVSGTLPYIVNDCTVVCGTADPYLPAEEIDKLSERSDINLLTIPDADHSLTIEGDYRASLDALTKVCGAYESIFGKLR